MKTIVPSAGVSGATTGWFLYEAGHEVTVLDRQPPASLEISSADGAQTSVSCGELRASRSAPFKAQQWLTKKNSKENAPLVFPLRPDPIQWRWRTPCPLPHVGRSRVQNSLLRAGHSTLDQAHSCGSATAVTVTVSEQRLTENCAFANMKALRAATVPLEALREAA